MLRLCHGKGVETSHTRSLESQKRRLATGATEMPSMCFAEVDAGSFLFVHRVPNQPTKINQALRLHTPQAYVLRPSIIPSLLSVCLYSKKARPPTSNAFKVLQENKPAPLVCRSICFHTLTLLLGSPISSLARRYPSQLPVSPTSDNPHFYHKISSPLNKQPWQMTSMM